jgi:hypothetical protein
LVLGEVGNPPSLETFEQQPKWSLYVIWGGMVRWTKRDELRTLVNDSRMLGLEDAAYHEAVAPFRAACGLEPLSAATPAP